jgi:hypothetical protein
MSQNIVQYRCFYKAKHALVYDMFYGFHTSVLIISKLHKINFPHRIVSCIFVHIPIGISSNICGLRCTLRSSPYITVYVGAGRMMANYKLESTGSGRRKYANYSGIFPENMKANFQVWAYTASAEIGSWTDSERYPGTSEGIHMVGCSDNRVLRKPYRRHWYPIILNQTQFTRCLCVCVFVLSASITFISV